MMQRWGVSMRKTALMFVSMLPIASGAALAQGDLSPRMAQDIECFKRHGLIQGTPTEMNRGDAHFAVLMVDTAIGFKKPIVRFNGAFIEGKAKLSPEILKQCNPNINLEKGPR